MPLPAGSSPASVPIWGYADSAGGAASVPGPLIVANVGETLEVTLHNDLAQPSSLAFPGQLVVPDTTGVGPGGQKTYAVELNRPGTFRYEAGLTSAGPRQVAMGLQGVLVVRPTAAGQAYDDPGSAFDDEAVVVISSIDPAFSNSPANFDLTKYAPKFWLLNGEAFPDTDLISTGAGRSVLLRYVNGGIFPVSMGLLGLHQTVIGQEARAREFPNDVVAETLPPGTTLDAVTAVPASTSAGTRFPVFEQGGRLDNGGKTSGSFAHGGTVDFGGALTYLAVTTAAGPVTTSVAVAPDPSNGSAALTFTADISDELTGADEITGAEYFIDTTGPDGTGGSMTLSGTGVQRQAQAVAVPSGLGVGEHTLYVHGMDATGAWGDFGTKTFRIDNAGPSAAVTLDPNPGNDSGAVAVTVTGDDTGTGGSDVTAAEMYVASACGSGTPTALVLSPPAGPTSIFTGSIPAGRAEGSYPVRVRARDAVGAWGPCAEETLVVDKTGPASGAVSAAPNPAAATATVSLTATATDPSVVTPASTITTAEWFEGADPGVGNGAAMSATDGAFDETSEPVRATLNASTLSAGSHTVSVRARDAAGNWGSVGTTVLTVTPSDVVFADGFESGNLSAWSGSSGGSGRIGVSAAAALTGSFGMRAVVTGNTPSYVRDDRPANQASAHARFRFDPNGTTTNGLTTSVLLGRTGGGTAIFRVQYRTSGGAFQVRAQVQRTGGTSSTSWFTVADAPHVIEIAWRSATSAAFSLYVDGTLRQTLSGLNTNSWRLEQVRMGPQAGLSAGMSGTEYFDDYVMTRTTLVGP